MTKAEIAKVLILRTVGNFLLLFSLFGVFATFGPALYYEAGYRVASLRGVKYAVADIAEVEPEVSKCNPCQGDSLSRSTRRLLVSNEPQIPSLFGALVGSSKQHMLIPASTEFSIVIPKIGVNEQVFENVDPTNQEEYLPLLQKGIAHAKGTTFPGMGGTIYLFAHSADNFWNVGTYNAAFYLLKELEPGDEIAVFFQDRRYNYVVFDKKIAEPSFVSYLTENVDQAEVLVLQTCWPPGTTWKRLFVFAKPKT